jgi:hypothetical protein
LVVRPPIRRDMSASKAATASRSAGRCTAHDHTNKLKVLALGVGTAEFSSCAELLKLLLLCHVINTTPMPF